MEAVKRVGGRDRFAIFLPTQRMDAAGDRLGLQAGSPLLARRRDARRVRRARVPRARSTSTSDLFRDGLAPPVAGNEIANLYQEFERGTSPCTSPGRGTSASSAPPAARAAGRVGDGAAARARRRRSPACRSPAARAWCCSATRSTRRTAWQLIEFLSRPEQQLRFWRLTGDLPARRRGVARHRARARPAACARSASSSSASVPTPKIPEWEQIAIAAAGAAPSARSAARAAPDSALAALDRDVDRILEKRRWLLERARAAPRRRRREAAR